MPVPMITPDPGRVALFLPSLRGGGAERVTLTLANAMARRGIVTDLVLCKAEGEYLDDVAPELNIVDLGSARVLPSLPALVRYIRRERPDAMFSAMNHANVVAYMAAKLAGGRLKLVMTEHNTLSRSKAITGRKGAILKALMRKTYLRCDRVVAVSDGVARDLEHQLGLGTGHVRTIYNPVVSSALELRSRELPEEVSRIERPLLVAVGRLIEQKDYPTMLRAFARVRGSTTATLAILGTGHLQTDLEGLALELGIATHVRFLGFRENPYAWMRAADLFVMSSSWEGLPTVLIEAMACGARVISTDCPSGPNEILEGGKWGTLVPVGDDAALAEAIKQALEDGAFPDGQRRASAFTVDAAVDAYLDLVLPLEGAQGQIAEDR